MGLPAQWGGVGLKQEEQDEPSEGVVISEGEEELYECTACLFVWGYMMCALGRVFKYRCVHLHLLGSIVNASQQHTWYR